MHNTLSDALHFLLYSFYSRNVKTVKTTNKLQNYMHIKWHSLPHAMQIFWPTLYCLITAVVLIAIAAIVGRRDIAGARIADVCCLADGHPWSSGSSIIRDEDRNLVTATATVAAGGCYVDLHSVSNMASISHLLLFAVGFLVMSTDASSKCAIQRDGLAEIWIEPGRELSRILND